jgi:hypothetical protein
VTTHPETSPSVQRRDLEDIASQFALAHQHFATAKQEIDWAKASDVIRGFWPPETRATVRKVTGAVLQQYLTKLDSLTRAWNSLAGGASEQLIHKFNESYEEQNRLRNARSTDPLVYRLGASMVPDREGRLVEEDLLVDGSLSIGELDETGASLNTFDLRRVIFTGHVRLRVTLRDGLRLNRVHFVRDMPLTPDEERAVRQFATNNPFVAELDRDAERGRRTDLIIVRSTINQLALDDVVAFKVSIVDSTIKEQKFDAPDILLSRLDVRSFSLVGTQCEAPVRARKDNTFGSVLLRNSTFEKGADFSDAVIESLAAPNAHFKLFAYFRKTRFLTAPVFHDATFPSDTDFFGITVDDPSRERDAVLQARSAYRALRLAAGQAKAHVEEARFLALEERASYRLLNWRSDPMLKLLSITYYLVSNYGTSPGRAIAAFILWNVSWAAILAAAITAAPWLYAIHGSRIHLGFPANPPAIQINCPSGAPDCAHAFRAFHTLGLAFQNAINPLAIVNSNSFVTVTRFQIVLLSVIQSVGSFSIFALLLFAIRSRFQRGG